jgi:predicted glycogen debranching enzyme
MDLPAITFQKDALSRFDKVLAKEWIITNGLGSYASQTVPALNTRKYHGLLIAALQPPGDRTVCLSKIDEDIIVGNDTYRLGSNEFQNTIYPNGYKLIDHFSITPFPTYFYKLDKFEVTKSIFLPNYLNAVVILYNIQNAYNIDAEIHLYPLLTCRYFHTVIDRLRTSLNFSQESSKKEVQTIFRRPQAAILCRSTEGIFREGVNWVERLTYREESSRGEANVDDCFQPGYFEVKVPNKAKKTFALICSVATGMQEARGILDSLGKTSNDLDELYKKEQNRHVSLLTDFYNNRPEVPMSDWLNWILFAADSFMVKNTDYRKAIIAGYHWFEPWGRDTFISLPGLTLVIGRTADAKDILQNFIQYCKGGLIPNFVTDKTGLPVYNTVDGTLWYVNAVLQYAKYTKDFDFIEKELWNNLQSIIENHQNGTMFGIRLDKDGLLMHGPRLTWMDAVVEGDMITARAGKAVEIQALWYNTVRSMETFARLFHQTDLADEYAAMAETSSRSFNSKFWNPNLDCLFDVLEPSGGIDASLRPNQIFAVSLDYSMLDKERSKKVVDIVNRNLTTPYGLRTLSLDDPKFIGKCIGDRRSRDTAYHNGTIWPWLLGPYITAYVKVSDYSVHTRKQALENLIIPLFSVGIHQGGLGTVNEIYDCDPPNDPRGCISQAWSIAEPLRAYIEDVLGVKPNNLARI